MRIGDVMWWFLDEDRQKVCVYDSLAGKEVIEDCYSKVRRFEYKGKRLESIEFTSIENLDTSGILTFNIVVLDDETV